MISDFSAVPDGIKNGGLLRMLIATLVLMFALPADALDWPSDVEVGQLLILDAPEGVACTWEVTGQKGDGPYEPVWREFPGAVAVETRYVGLLTVSLTTDATRGLRDVRWSVAVGGGDDPNPDPDPDPPPPPPPGRIFAVMVFENGDRDDYTVDQLATIESESVREYMVRKGYGFDCVDQDVKGEDGTPPVHLRSFLDRAKGKALPRIIVVDRNGKPLIDELIESEERVLKILKKYGGE